jgi:hypothetical protein
LENSLFFQRCEISRIPLNPSPPKEAPPA